MTYFVEVDVHALELKVRGAVVDTRAVEAMLAGNSLPVSVVSLAPLYSVTKEFKVSSQNAAPIWLP